MDIEFSQIHEMVYMHDIVNSDSKKKPRIPLKKFLNAEKVLTLILSSIDSLSKLVLNNPLSVLFTSTVRRNNNRAKMNVEFDSWICTRCC